MLTDLKSGLLVPDALPELAVWDAPDIRRLASAAAGERPFSDALDGLSRAVNLAIAEHVARRHFGTMFTFAQQCEGRLIHDLVPRPGREYENSNASRVTFGAHTDDALLEDDFRAENLLLIGVDNPGAVPTHLFPLDSVLDRLTARAIEVLMEPRFVFACPESFEVANRDAIASPARAILREREGAIHIRFASYSTLARQGDGEADLVVAELRHALETLTPERVVLNPGTMLTFSNSRFLHGRGAVAGRRWVKRCYLKRDCSVLERLCATGDRGVFDLEVAISSSARATS